MAKVKFRKRLPSEKTYTTMFDAIYARLRTSRAYSEDMASREAFRRVQQRREADRKAIGLPAHWPVFETPLEHTDRELRLRRETGLCRDDADRVMCIEDVQKWRTVEPTWSAEDLANHVSDRGFYIRYGWGWIRRIVQEILSDSELPIAATA